MIELLWQNPLAFFIIFPGLLLSITLHEFAHCWTADKLGDPTARARGRLTLNPKAHLDPLGVIAILLTRFGWGKPAPYDPYNLKEPVRDTALIALAGPLSNLSLALFFSILLKLIFIPWLFLQIALIQLVVINIMLAIFNLLPVHPLDGSKILRALLPKQSAYEYEQFMEHWGTLILILLIFPIFTPVAPVAQLVSPVINFILKMLL